MWRWPKPVGSISTNFSLRLWNVFNFMHFSRHFESVWIANYKFDFEHAIKLWLNYFPLYLHQAVSVCKAFPHDPPLPSLNTAFQSCHSNVRVKKCKQCCCWVSSAYKVLKVDKNSVDKLCSSIVKSSSFLLKSDLFYISLLCQPISFS